MRESEFRVSQAACLGVSFYMKTATLSLSLSLSFFYFLFFFHHAVVIVVVIAAALLLFGHNELTVSQPISLLKQRRVRAGNMEVLVFRV